ncbi:MAG: hypothetical protein Q9191_002860 [Dirinaria sp. TL-2023a]
MATPNPMKTTYPNPIPAISKKRCTVSGIITTVYGLEELPEDVTEVVCLWLLHPRLQTHSCMEPVAASAIQDWNIELERMKETGRRFGLIAVSFDQRNHGSREVDALANEAWRSGNKSHAPDMLAIYHGTATDVSLLMTYISSYIFPTANPTIVDHMVLGVSLGGHAAWHCVLHEPRISSAIIVIGCPDYFALMSDRARLSKLHSWTHSDPPGSQFIGSEDFPASLVEAVEAYDPAGIFMGPLRSRTVETYNRLPSDEEQRRLRPLMKRMFQGKRILNMAGAIDKLVPYKCGEPFLRWLKVALASDGWLGDGVFTLQDIIFDNVGHQMSSQMADKANEFILETMTLRSRPVTFAKI